MVFLSKLKKLWQTYSQRSEAQTIKKWVHRLFFVAILTYLLYQFSQVGWIKIYHSLPTQISFYLLFFPIFFILPISELFIYRILWGVRFRDIWPALLVKKVYNSDVMGYSGEVYLFQWANKSLSLDKTKIIKDVKDNNIISSIVSIIATIIALFLFFEYNPFFFYKWFNKIPNNQLYFWLIATVIIVFLFVRFRSYIFSLPGKTSMEIFSVHFIRHIIAFLLQVYQWHLVLPNVPVYVWITFMAVLLVMTRLPFLPNIDLLFVSISINITKSLGAPLAAISALLALNSILGKILHFFIYLYFNTVAKNKLAYLQTVQNETVEAADIAKSDSM